jgi:hypothetical protein
VEPERVDPIEVGDFAQGTPASRWALSRYLVGRAVADSVARSLLAIGLLLVAATIVLASVAHAPFWAIVVGLVALGVLALRTVLVAALRRLVSVGPADRRVRELLAATRADVRAELRRIGLPGRALPLLVWRFRAARRADTLSRLRGFDVDRVVPAARLDELHLLLRDGTGRPDRLAW